MLESKAIGDQLPRLGLNRLLRFKQLRDWTINQQRVIARSRAPASVVIYYVADLMEDDKTEGQRKDLIEQDLTLASLFPTNALLASALVV